MKNDKYLHQITEQGTTSLTDWFIANKTVSEPFKNSQHVIS